MTQSLTTSRSDSDSRSDRHGHCVPGRRARCSNHAGPGCASAHPSHYRATTCHGTLAVTVTDSGSLGLTRIGESRADSDRKIQMSSEALTGRAAGQPGPGMTTSSKALASWACAGTGPCGPRPFTGPARNRCKCAYDPDDDRTRRCRTAVTSSCRYRDRRA